MTPSWRFFRTHPFLRFSFAVILACATATAADSSPQLPPVLLQMIRDSSIHDELQLTDAQRDQIVETLRTVDGRWFRSRILAADKQLQEVTALSGQLRSKLDVLLDDRQATRLGQLECQALGTRMVLREEVADSLGLKASQRQALREVFLKTDQRASEIQKKLQAGETTAVAGNNELDGLKSKERQSVAGMLTQAQKSKLGSLTGSPFDFGTVRRMYPLAPELTIEGVTWIQGGPLRLEELRGKVVAVHFYAFQCINCQRNLPHYKAWYDDYADKDFVIIGIQTPETESERKLDRVTAAAKKEAMQYPLILDAESSNWKAWGNTMWPTVYLIDKQGFIRRWWQGEMNWKETPGEQQMRQSIEQLLAEDS